MRAPSVLWGVAFGALWVSGCGLGASVVGGPEDAAPMDRGALDSGALDSGTMDSGSMDSGAVDSGALDVVRPDVPDTGPARCVRNDECRDNELGLTVCDLPMGRCVECSPGADTCPAGRFCDGATYRCAPGCRNDEGCAAGVTADGGVSLPDGGARSLHCEVSTRRCLDCVTDAHCPAGLVCSGNQCVAGCNATQPCPAGRTCCDSACIDPQDNTAHCGGCGRVCTVANGAPVCTMGACAVGLCNGSFADCDGDASNGCETNTAMATAHCGGCGMACAARSHSTASCAAGACVYACDEGFADCDGMASNGCEVDTRSTPAHCGACDHACVTANGTASCTAGACGVGACNTGFGNCDGDAANGCETSTATSVTQCGACGNACPSRANATPTCAAGACSIACAAGFGNCDGNAANGCEVDTRVTLAHCGMCGNACPARANATPTCAAGACGFTCAAGFADCNGVASDGCEVNLGLDEGHCGSCPTVCPAGATCTAGVCACPLGTSSCAGACVNFTSDTRNCGACGTVCATGQVCRTGTCQATCASGSTLCGTQCVTLGDNPLNCGACGNRCAADSTCASGVCVPVVTIDPIGCADGTRESFTDRTRFPLIAGCSGAWSLPGIFPAIPSSTLAACATLGNSSVTAPANGSGCASSNLCARGWHICNGGEVTPRTGSMGCAAETAYPASSFFAASVSGTGCGVCALRSGSVTGASCTSLSCVANCRESGDLNNDFFGCGSLGSLVSGACDGLNRFSGNDCGSLGAPWTCGGSTQESRTVVKTSAAAGGVLCCRD